MGALSRFGSLLVLISITGCGGGNSPPRLIDGSRGAELPGVLSQLGDAFMTRTSAVPVSDVEGDELDACGFPPEAQDTVAVERVGLHGSSLTFAGVGSALYACDKIPDPITAEDPDLPYGGVWCGGSVGRLDAGVLNDPRLDLCSNTNDELTAFVWVEPQPATKWVVVTDAGRREVYEVTESLPVRVTTTDGVRPQSSRASFPIEEYAADGSKLREYTLDAQVAG
jgi:hypothetical protein